MPDTIYIIDEQDVQIQVHESNSQVTIVEVEGHVPEILEIHDTEQRSVDLHDNVTDSILQIFEQEDVVVHIYEPGAQGARGADGSSGGGGGSVPSGTVSSSQQIASDISGSFVSASNSLSGRIGVFEGRTLYSSSQQVNFSDISGSFTTSSFLQNNFTSSYNLFTSSIELKVQRLESVTSSFATNASTSSLLNNSYSASADLRIGRLETATASYAIKTEVSGAFTNVSSSLAGRLTTYDNKTLVSGSSQITYPQLSGIPSGILSSSQQINNLIPNIVTSSAQINTGSYSGSFYGNGANLTGIVSASYAVTASYVSGSSTSAISASYALSSSYAVSASYAPSISASYAATASVGGGIYGSSGVSVPNAVVTIPLNSLFRFRYSGSGVDGVILSEQTGETTLSSPDGLGYISLINGGVFYLVGLGSLDLAAGNQSLSFGSGTASFTDNNGQGLLYGGHYSASIITNDRFVPDVGTIKTRLTASYAISASYAPSSPSISASYASTSSFSPNIQTIGMRIKTEDSYIAEGSKGYRHIGYNSNIVKLRGIANIAGNININVKREGVLIGNYQLSNQSSSLDTTLTNWTSSLSTNDLLEFYVSQSSTYITDITFFMDLQSI